jgi:hypothetical protein
MQQVTIVSPTHTGSPAASLKPHSMSYAKEGVPTNRARWPSHIRHADADTRPTPAQWPGIDIVTIRRDVKADLRPYIRTD